MMKKNLDAFSMLFHFDYSSFQKSFDNIHLPEELRSSLNFLIEMHTKLRDDILKEIRDKEKEIYGSEFDDEKDKKTSEKCSESKKSTHENQDLEEAAEEEPKKPRKKRKFNGKRKLAKGKITVHPLEEKEKICPCCQSTMHMQRGKTRTWIVSLPILTTQTHVFESARCLTCSTQTTAKGKEELQKESIGHFHFSAVAALAALRYQYGMASYRMDAMSDALGISVPDSTQWHLFERVACHLLPFMEFLKKYSANAISSHTDDTHNMILALVKSIAAQKKDAQQKGKNPKSVRSGVHTTNITSKLKEGEIILYKTGLHHAGEVIKDYLVARTLSEKVILMSDAANCVTSKIGKDDVEAANCNSHVVRKFKDLAAAEKNVQEKGKKSNNAYIKTLDKFLSCYKRVFENDQATKNMSPCERLLYHKEHSKPLMDEMQQKALFDFKEKKVEPNSELGKVYQYFLNHFVKFCAFCRVENAPICNNRCEQMLKSIIRHRKNSLFFKTQIGATVADILTSILFTAKVNHLNTIEYLRDLCLYKEHWSKGRYEDFLPWNYVATMTQLKEIQYNSLSHL
jgi:transposase